MYFIAFESVETFMFEKQILKAEYFCEANCILSTDKTKLRPLKCDLRHLKYISIIFFV